MYPIIDTHTHFDVDCFNIDRRQQSKYAYENGVRHLVLIGFLAKYFSQMVTCHEQMQIYIQNGIQSPVSHLAFGLHPFYISEHTEHDLMMLESYLQRYPSIAIGEIGLDTFTAEMKQPHNYQRQQDFFVKQLSLAQYYKLPVLLHIRRAHADVLKLLKSQHFQYGGIAHSFSGGIQEAKALINLGFKIGITGQVTNPNAKKLRNTVQTLFNTFGLAYFVIETDCPDMMPLVCQTSDTRRNVPANLLFVLNELSSLLAIEKAELARHLWHNSTTALNTDWPYPYANEFHSPNYGRV